VADEQLGFGWGDEPRVEAGGAGARLEPLPQIAPLAERLAALARRNIFIGTSSWKYPGWIGNVYDPVRYVTRGKLSKKRFEQTCLEEYARVFPTVGGDFSFYQFPTEQLLERYFSQVPEGFRFSLKVPEDITVPHFPKHARYGTRAGKPNPDFLSAQKITDHFLRRLEPYRSKLGVLMFEFGTIHASPLCEPNVFAEALDRFLSKLPVNEFKFSVEVRNATFLTEGVQYVETLSKHNVAHCFNSWTRMPSVIEQLAIPNIATAPHAVGRMLLKPGRTYAQAVKKFAPYERIDEVYQEGRDGMKTLIQQSMDRHEALFIFVNNRFEGNAVETIREIVDDLPEV